VATDELVFGVEEEEAGGVAVLDGESGEGVVFAVELEHGGEVDVGEDIDVVEEEGFVSRVASGPLKLRVNARPRRARG